MIDYNLLVLSWSEFENLTKDLLEKKFNLYIESFTAGRDEKIDLRFSITKDQKGIIQCKRYEKYSDLISRLKTEVDYIKSKSYENYYISTTVGLTPKNKREIYELFQPFIKSEEYIFGKSEINSMIFQYKEIETKYYKLWLSSTNILNKIIHSKVYNISQIDKESVNNITKVYVQNESTKLSQEIIEKNHYVIISGIPGIGKTTLAKIVVYALLANGIEELISITQNISEAFEILHESQSQVFFYDDFLGRNFLETNLDKNEDNQLIKFIKLVKETKNKYLIMTTREYILKQAQIKYELLNDHDIDIAKCTIDLSQYTELIRAKILYNHLFFSNIPKKFIFELVKESRYKQFIKHKNYNPRIIETILNKKDWETVPVEKYFKCFINYFDNPESVWRHTFENQITSLSQQVLLIVGSLNCTIEYSNLKKLTLEYIKIFEKNIVNASFDINFDKAINELEGTFIKIEKDSENIFGISFLNPSISDFLNNYLFEKEEIMANIINNSIFLEQLFTFNNIYKQKNCNEKSIKIKKLCEDKLLEKLDNYQNCKLERVQYVGKPTFSWRLMNNSEINRLFYIINEMMPINNEEVKNILAKKFRIEYNKGVEETNIRKVVNIYINLYKEIAIDLLEILEYLFNKNEWMLNLNYIVELKKVDPTIFNEYIEKTEVKEKIDNIIEMECENIDGDSIEYTKSNIEEIELSYNLDLSEYKDYLTDELYKYQSEQEEVVISRDFKSSSGDAENIEDIIEEMFESLLINE